MDINTEISRLSTGALARLVRRTRVRAVCEVCSYLLTWGNVDNVRQCIELFSITREEALNADVGFSTLEQFDHNGVWYDERAAGSIPL